MKVQLLSGPLDGATVETSDRAIEPEMIHFSESRRVHHYLWHADTEFRYLCHDTIIDDRSAFEAWWKKQNADETAKAIAWEAWQTVLDRF